MTIDIEPILARYSGLSAAIAKSLGNAGGFSGARLWQLTLADKSFCLRRWPAEHPTKQKLQWISDLLAHLHGAGVPFVPVPIKAESGESFHEHGDHLWEVSPWMPGRADFGDTADEAIRETRLSNAIKALALWHNVAASFQRPTSQTAPGIQMRLRRYQELRHGKLSELRRRVSENRFAIPQNIVSTTNALLNAFANARDLSPDLRRMSQVPVELQPCIRDIWHDHVLFTGNDVTGIVDFGAAKIAAREGDVARLLGSLAGSAISHDAAERLWTTGLSVYQTTANRPIDVEMVRVWNRANVSMSGLQWVEWLFCEGRQFDDLDSVHQRMLKFLSLS